MNSTGKIAGITAKAQPAVTIITKLGAINAEMKRLNAVGVPYQHDLHVLACSVLVHIAKHRNITVLHHFLESVPDAVRKNSLQSWFETFGTVTFSAVNEGEKAVWRLDAAKTAKLGDAMVKPFWKFKALEGAPYQPLDMNDYINKQVRLLEKDKAAVLKADPQADVSKQSALIMMLKTHDAAAASN